MNRLLYILTLIIPIITGCKSGGEENDSKTKPSKEQEEKKLKNGDIIFQNSKSDQSRAIRLATGSKYTHMGIIYVKEGQPYVFEAAKTVRSTPLDKWIDRGKNDHYVVKRLENADNVLTDDVLDKMERKGEAFKGKPYDLYFEWSDERIYCSELVWKIYKRAAGIRIGELKKLSEFDLSKKPVKKKLKERYGEDIPRDEKVISPASMFGSDKLVRIREE